MKILAFVKKVPGGLMVVPLLCGVILNSIPFTNSILNMGGLVSALWTAQGTNTIIALMMFCVGTFVDLRQSVEAFKRGGVLLIAKFISGALTGVIIGKLFGNAGILGISTLAFVSAITSSNGGMYMSLMMEYGDQTDVAANILISLNNGPLLPLLAFSVSGTANIPTQSLIATLIPMAVGMVLGGLDKDIAAFCKPGAYMLMPFFAFCLGTTITIKNVLVAGLPGILLGIISVVWSGAICIAADKFILRRPGYAGAAQSSVAGSSVQVPPIVGLASAELAPFIADATIQCASAAIITMLLTPILTDWAYKKWAKPKEENTGAAA